MSFFWPVCRDVQNWVPAVTVLIMVCGWGGDGSQHSSSRGRPDTPHAPEAPCKLEAHAQRDVGNAKLMSKYIVKVKRFTHRDVRMPFRKYQPVPRSLQTVVGCATPVGPRRRVGLSHHICSTGGQRLPGQPRTRNHSTDIVTGFAWFVSNIWSDLIWIMEYFVSIL